MAVELTEILVVIFAAVLAGFTVLAAFLFEKRLDGSPVQALNAMWYRFWHQPRVIQIAISLSVLVFCAGVFVTSQEFRQAPPAIGGEVSDGEGVMTAVAHEARQVTIQGVLWLDSHPEWTDMDDSITMISPDTGAKLTLRPGREALVNSRELEWEFVTTYGDFYEQHLWTFGHEEMDITLQLDEGVDIDEFREVTEKAKGAASFEIEGESRASVVGSVVGVEVQYASLESLK